MTVPFPGVLGTPEINLAKYCWPQSSPEHFIFTPLSPPTHIHETWGRGSAQTPVTRDAGDAGRGSIGWREPCWRGRGQSEGYFSHNGKAMGTDPNPQSCQSHSTFLPHHPNTASRIAQPSMVLDPFPGSHAVGSASSCQSHPSVRPMPAPAPKGWQSQPQPSPYCRATAPT